MEQLQVISSGAISCYLGEDPQLATTIYLHILQVKDPSGSCSEMQSTVNAAP